jgi:hypothetical protein
MIRIFTQVIIRLFGGELPDELARRKHTGKSGSGC